MHILERLVKADPWRPTRFHDMYGHPVDARSWLDLPRVLVESAAREIFDYRPPRPWINYNAIRHLERLVQSNWRVLEFGSGMSTVWFARRCTSVHSIESDDDWYKKVALLLEKYECGNVTLEHRSGEEKAIDAYVDLSSYPPASLDCVFVDGHARDRCVESALRVIKPGGVIYLDNVDQGSQWPVYARAEQQLLTAAQQNASKITYHIGFAPAQFVATRGMLVEWHP